jgi:hypothetical protein
MKIFLSLLLLGFSGELRAQSGEFWLSAGGSILANKDIGSPFPAGSASDTQLANGFRIGFRYTFNSAGHLGHEIQYAYNRTSLMDNTGVVFGAPGSAGMAIHQAGYNLLYYFPATKEGMKVRPFVTGGVHVSDFALPGSALSPGSSYRAGGNLGAGVKVRLSPLFAVRLDVREYVTGKPNWNGLLVNQGAALFQTEISAGFGVYF